MIRFLLPLFLALGCLGAQFDRSLAFRAQASVGGLLAGLQAGWNFDEQFNGATNRFSDFGGLVFTNVGALTGSERSVSSGGVNITNSGAGYLDLTNAAIFAQNASFTMSFWICGGLSGSNPCDIGQHVNTTTYDYRWDGQSFNLKDAIGNGHQVTGTLLGATFWTHVVCGYDSANGVIFIASNGGAKTTTACPSVRQTANMPMRITINPAVVDNFYFWNRALTATEITQLYNSGYALQYPFNEQTPGASLMHSYAWGVTNSSGTVSSNSLFAVTQVCNDLNAASVLTRYTCIIPFCPDSLQAALTPILPSPSAVPTWNINGGNAFIALTVEPYRGLSGFVGGDLTVNGLTGNGSSKFVNLFPSPNNPSGGLRVIMPNPLDAGKIIYCYTANSGVYVEEGYYDSGAAGQDNSILTVAYNSAPINRHRLGGLASTAGTNVSLTGFYSQQRVSNTELDVYFANSTNPHFLYLNDTTASGVSSWRVNFIGYALFDYWDAVGGGPAAGNFTANTLSIWASLRLHITSSESAASYTAFQTFRTTLGGGFQ